MLGSCEPLVLGDWCTMNANVYAFDEVPRDCISVGVALPQSTLY